MAAWSEWWAARRHASSGFQLPPALSLVESKNSATMLGHKPSLNKLIISHCFCSVLLLGGRAKDDV